MRILFIHEGLGQFEKLHLYLNAQGLAHSTFMCSSGVYNTNKDKIPNLLSFQAVAENDKNYFYTRSIEARTQRSFFIKKSLNEYLTKSGVDVIVAHGSGGFPLQLFDEFSIPIISYVEFPSFTLHGNDPKYPQPDYATYKDKIFEMTSFHQVLKSELTIVPSTYAKGLFPTCLHDRIIPQMEGFEIVRKSSKFMKKEGFFYIGFAARDLSSAKGFEQFILIAKEILKTRQNVKFVFCGSAKVLYSYEVAFLQNNFEKDQRPESFMQYILDREGITLGDDSPFEHVDYAVYDQFADYIEGMDMFLYPLQFGSANWGLFEIAFRGRIIIGSDRCFVPEVIRHGYNGLLCPYDDVQLWARMAIDVVDSPQNYAKLGKAAEIDANERFHISKVAQRYLDIFQTAISKKKLNLY